MNNIHNIHRQLPFINRMTGSCIYLLQHICPKSRLLELIRLKNVASAISHVKSPPQQVLEVPREKNLSEKKFIADYLLKQKPVIFDGQALTWAATQKWNLSYFQEAFFDETFSVIETSGLVEKDQLKSPFNKKEVTGAQFVEAIKRGEAPYMRFCPILETHPQMRDELDLTWLKKMRRCFLGVSYQTFIGASSRKTPLHSESTSFFFIMIDGEKKWNLYAPSALTFLNPLPEGKGYHFTDYTKKQDTRFPGVSLLQHYQCTLKKGDILYVPTWMWHEVENLSDSWGVSYRFTNLRGFLGQPALALIRILLTKPNFLTVLYYSFFRSDVSKRTKNPLTPKIFFRD